MKWSAHSYLSSGRRKWAWADLMARYISSDRSGPPAEFSEMGGLSATDFAGPACFERSGSPSPSRHNLHVVPVSTASFPGPLEVCPRPGCSPRHMDDLSRYCMQIFRRVRHRSFTNAQSASRGSVCKPSLVHKRPVVSQLGKVIINVAGDVQKWREPSVVHECPIC